VKLNINRLFSIKYLQLFIIKTFVTDLEILVVLVTRLLKQDFNRLVNGIEPVELWDEG
jgi:hypothetical protein